MRKDIKERSRGALSYQHQAIPIVFQVFLRAYGSEPFLSRDLTEIILCRFQDGLKAIDYSDDEIKHIMGNVSHYINSNKSSMFDGFI